MHLDIEAALVGLLVHAISRLERANFQILECHDHPPDATGRGLKRVLSSPDFATWGHRLNGVAKLPHPWPQRWPHLGRDLVKSAWTPSDKTCPNMADFRHFFKLFGMPEDGSLVRDAVWSEPVSACDSLFCRELTGKTENAVEIGAAGRSEKPGFPALSGAKSLMFETGT
jgi:hypothetical protein